MSRRLLKENICRACPGCLLPNACLIQRGDVSAGECERLLIGSEELPFGSTGTRAEINCEHSRCGPAADLGMRVSHLELADDRDEPRKAERIPIGFHRDADGIFTLKHATPSDL